VALANPSCGIVLPVRIGPPTASRRIAFDSVRGPCREKAFRALEMTVARSVCESSYRYRTARGAASRKSCSQPPVAFPHFSATVRALTAHCSPQPALVEPPPILIVAKPMHPPCHRVSSLSIGGTCRPWRLVREQDLSGSQRSSNSSQTEPTVIRSQPQRDAPTFRGAGV
jgi:hypothetical protein